MKSMNEKQAEQAINRRKDGAKKILESEKKLDLFLLKLEKKLKSVPKVGDRLSHAVVMIEMLKSYAKKEYTDVPLGAMIAIVAALSYFLSPIDLIPDCVPVAGYVDDGMIVLVCWSLVEDDINDFINWRDNKEN